MGFRLVPGRLVAAACCVGSCVGLLTGCVASRHASDLPAGATRAALPTGTGGKLLRVLQMNLCNSGIAECYTGGRSVIMAAAVIGAQRPDIVTLNEVCRGDLSVLEGALSATNGGATVASAFNAAADRRTGGPFRCRNGQEFGDGVLAVVSRAAPAFHTQGGSYPMQDLSDPEERVWVCIDEPAQLSACSTHLASMSTTVALAQCRYFLRSDVPRIRQHNGDEPLVLGADLNLPVAQSPGPETCLPNGYNRADDNGRQDVVASPGVVVGASTVIDMRGTTDHPGLLVEVRLPYHVAPR